MRVHFISLRVLFAVLTFTMAAMVFSPSPVLAAENPTRDPDLLKRYGKFGGPFELIDQTGKTVRDTDFQGKYVLVFFGYTFCPDVCPTVLQTVSDSLDLMGDLSKEVQPIFITVDPERDTTEVMADYVSNFGHNLVGLTGDTKAIAAVARSYGVRFEKDAADDGTPIKDNSYLMSHTAATFMMNRKGRYLVLFPLGVSPQDMARNLIGIIQKKY